MDPRHGKRGLFLLALLAAAVGTTLFLRHWLAGRPYRRADYLLGTLVEITAYGPQARKGTEAAFAAMREVERLADPRRPEGDVARINREAGRGPVPVDRRTLALLRLSLEWYDRSGGVFDVTVAPLVAAWGFEPDGEPRLPEAAAVQRALELVGSEDLEIDEEAGTAYLRRKGMALDLGAIAKGYAVDLAYEALRLAGVERALINGGGSSIRALGSPPGDKWWRIGIAHPRPERESLLAVLLLGPGQAMGTSADNQRYFMAEGRRYSHLLDPRNGRPGRETILCTIVAGNAADADALSTACFLSGPASGLALAVSAGAEALFYGQDGRTVKTPGLRMADTGLLETR